MKSLKKIFATWSFEDWSVISAIVSIVGFVTVVYLNFTIKWPYKWMSDLFFWGFLFLFGSSMLGMTICSLFSDKKLATKLIDAGSLGLVGLVCLENFFDHLCREFFDYDIPDLYSWYVAPLAGTFCLGILGCIVPKTKAFWHKLRERM